MKILNPLLLLSLAALYTSQCFAEVEMLDRIVAIVDDRAITQSELDDRVNEITANANASGVKLPARSVINEQVLDMLISETLQLNVASRYGVSPTEQEVDAAINNVIQGQGITVERLKSEIAKTGKTYNEYKQVIRKQLTIQQITRGLVSSRIEVSDQDIDSFLKSADAKFWASPDFHLGHIVLPVPQSATFEQVQEIEKKANAIYQKLLDGKNFEETAIAESKGPAALKGGDLGWRKSSSLPTLFAEVAPKMQVGQISKPIRSQAGFHILKLKNKKGDEKQIITQSKVSHILIKASEILDLDQAKEKLEGIRQDIVEGKATFSEMAKNHTDDIGSKLSGGDMGWSSPGVFVPEFEKMMNNIEVGKISEPFLTQFGWHILVVEERKEEDVTDEVLRMRAQNMIRSQRFEDEVQLWIQDMRDNAYIEIKI